MLDLPQTIVLFDTEYTCWEGSRERNWSGPNEHREIVQIGALRVDSDRLTETDAFDVLVRPRKNPLLSGYFTSLTGITQERIETKGVEFPTAIRQFSLWCEGFPLYSFGRDGEVLEQNCTLVGIVSPIANSRFHNIRDVFQKFGVSTENYTSGTIVQAFGREPVRRAHNSLNDVRTILDGLRELSRLTQIKAS